MTARCPHPPAGTFSHLRREKAAPLLRLLLCEAWEKVAEGRMRASFNARDNAIWNIFP